MQLKDFATNDVITIQADKSIDEVLGLFRKHNVRHLPVIRDGVPVGIVSEGDVLVTVGGLLSNQRISTRDATVSYAGPTTVDQIMTSGPVTLSPDHPIVEAARLMLERHIAAIVVVADETIAGIVSERDFLRQFVDESTLISGACRQQPVSEHMSTNVVTATQNENVFTLMREMGKKIHHLPIVENGKLVGIVSDHDVRRALAADKIQQIMEPIQQIRLMENFNAGRIMNKNLQTTTPTASLAEAAQKMIRSEIGALPVLQTDAFVGIITETDIMRACVKVLENAT